MIRRILPTLALLLVATPLPAASPEAIDGLEAWYRTESLHVKMRDGDVVSRWQDSSGKGHDLVSDNNGPRAVFHTLQVDGQPSVHLQKLNTFSVRDPFELDDHTIFLVYSATCKECALFHGPGQAGYGVLLRDDGERDFINFGPTPHYYNQAVPTGSEYRIATLARQDGVLRSFLDGADVSSGDAFAEPLRVGKFFRVSMTQAAKRDAAGLRLAEMIFYDRYLNDEERTAVTDYLSRKFGIEVSVAVSEGAGTAAADDSRPERPPPREADATAVLSAEASGNVNTAEPHAIGWNVQRKIAPPLRHDPSSENSRLYCDRNGTRVRLFVSLPLATAAEGAAVRVLVMKNYREYLPQEAGGGSLVAGSTRVELDVTLEMQKGEFVEIITIAAGAEGPVSLAAGAVLIATAEPLPD